MFFQTTLSQQELQVHNCHVPCPSDAVGSESAMLTSLRQVTSFRKMAFQPARYVLRDKSMSSTVVLLFQPPTASIVFLLQMPVPKNAVPLSRRHRQNSLCRCPATLITHKEVRISSLRA